MPMLTCQAKRCPEKSLRRRAPKRAAHFRPHFPMPRAGPPTPDPGSSSLLTMVLELHGYPLPLLIRSLLTQHHNRGNVSPFSNTCMPCSSPLPPNAPTRQPLLAIRILHDVSISVLLSLKPTLNEQRGCIPTYVHYLLLSVHGASVRCTGLQQGTPQPHLSSTRHISNQSWSTSLEKWGGGGRSPGKETWGTQVERG
jgi:hypothetical protein